MRYDLALILAVESSSMLAVRRAVANATMRLYDGDRIQIDGERGSVELLTHAN